MLRRLIAVLSLIILSGPWGVTRAFSPAPDQILSGSGAGLPSARFFGQSLSANGQYLAVGAPSGAGSAAPGAVWVYARNGAEYTLSSVLQAPSPQSGDGFGQHVQFVGNQLLVGAPFRTVAQVVARGEVFVYTLSAGQFTLAQTLQPGVATGANDWFGFHLSADSGWLAVGVPRAGSSDEGQVQLYRYDAVGEVWLYHSALTATAAIGRLGLRVLVRGDRVLASASQEPSASNLLNRGFVYEYLRTGAGAGASFSQTQRFRPSTFPEPTSPQGFGSALSLSPDGNWLIVGAPFDEELADQRVGAAYVFIRTGGQWAQAQRIASPDIALGENFGGAVAFDGSVRMLIGDIRRSTGNGLQTGAVHEYRLTVVPESIWALGRSWLRGAGSDQDFFGSAVLVDSGNLIIGSSGSDASGQDSGNVYVYSALFADGFE
mgnify:FL=1